MSGTDDLRDRIGIRSSYFYLSYAHSAPLAGNTGADPDKWVTRFFHDLADSVRSLASPESHLVPGFYDQEIPLSSDRKAALARALSTAEVFVPLYSPGYFAKSWPGREWACFHQRLAEGGLAEPERRFAPVLWIPLPARQDPPGLDEALAVGSSESAYAENGLRALLRLKPYRPSYRVVVDRLAAHIVEVAENDPVPPSAAPDIDDVISPFSGGAPTLVFTVTVAAPVRHTLPPGRESTGYGDRSVGWRPYPREQDAPIADYAVWAAEQLDVAVSVVGIESPRDSLQAGPGVILIDPWLAADDHGLGVLQSMVSDLPAWVIPVIILETAADEQLRYLVERVRSLLPKGDMARAEMANRVARNVDSLQEFVSLMPILVAETERRYLRHGPIVSSTSPPQHLPILGDDRGVRSALPPKPDEEQKDA